MPERAINKSFNMQLFIVNFTKYNTFYNYHGFKNFVHLAKINNKTLGKATVLGMTLNCSGV